MLAGGAVEGAAAGQDFVGDGLVADDAAFSGTAVNGQWILSPPRIPISPSRPEDLELCE